MTKDSLFDSDTFGFLVLDLNFFSELLISLGFFLLKIVISIFYSTFTSSFGSYFANLSRLLVLVTKSKFANLIVTLQQAWAGQFLYKIYNAAFSISLAFEIKFGTLKLQVFSCQSSFQSSKITVLPYARYSFNFASSFSLTFFISLSNSSFPTMTLGNAIEHPIYFFSVFPLGSCYVIDTPNALYKIKIDSHLVSWSSCAHISPKWVKTSSTISIPRILNSAYLTGPTPGIYLILSVFINYSISSSLALT